MNTSEGQQIQMKKPEKVKPSFSVLALKFTSQIRHLSSFGEEPGL